MAHATGTVSTLISGNDGEGSIFADAKNVYFNLAGNIKVVSKNGGTVTTLVPTGNADGRLSDGTSVYFEENGMIKTIPVGGGAVADLIPVPNGGIAGFAIDDNFIYWTDRSCGAGASKIWRRSKP